MKLPPDDTNDITPVENLIITVDLGGTKTVNVDEQKTRVLGGPHIDVHTLVRARQGARESAFSECKRTCREFYLSWRRGVVTGALSMAGIVAAVIGAAWAWLKWGR